MRSRLTPLIKIFYNPLQAMADIALRSPYITAVLLATASTLVYYYTLDRQTQSSLARRNAPDSISFALLSQMGASFSPIIFLAVIFVPLCLLAANLIDRRSSFRVMLRQEYAPFASGILYAWAAAHLMLLLPALVLVKPLPSGAYGVEAASRLALLKLVPLLYFGFLVVIAFRAILRLRYGQAIGALAISALSMVLIPLLPSLLFLLTSPFIAILLFLMLRNFFSDVLSAQRSREAFRQNLEAATLNPADASAHYNLGLIYQQRGEYEEAKRSFLRAVEIDTDETDAHYQLGRIAREEGNLNEAISRFDQVVTSDPEHNQSEVWREIGSAYFQAGQFADAREAFEHFLDKRPSDAEGRYRYGLTLYNLGRSSEAADEMRACIEAVRTAPAYKYRTEKRWMNEAQSFLRSQSANT